MLRIHDKMQKVSLMVERVNDYVKWHSQPVAIFRITSGLVDVIVSRKQLLLLHIILIEVISSFLVDVI